MLLVKIMEAVRGELGIPSLVGLDVLTRYSEAVRIEAGASAINRGR